MFDHKEIKPFDWAGLNGKTLEMKVMAECGCTVVAGLDQETGACYILHEQHE